MRANSLLTVVFVSVLLPGCVAGTIIAAPFKVAGTVVETAVDATTQTQSEKEEDLGRQVLAERKKQRKLCLDEAQNKQERRNCKEAYERYD